MRVLTLPDESQWTLETLETLDGARPSREGRAKRRPRVSHLRRYVWVRCICDAGERRLPFATSWVLWPERQLADALTEALAHARGRPAGLRRSLGGVAGSLVAG